MIIAKDLEVRIGARVLLHPSTFQIGPGDRVGLVGRNGAGKTTLLRLIMGFLPGHSGRVLLDGTDLALVPARHRARLGLGYAPEDRVLFPTFNVEENLRFPCEVIGMPRRAVDERLAETLTIVPELKNMLARSGSALSGGQGKMVALGRAVMAGERLVLLDEPFQGLAPVLAQRYAAALRALRDSHPDIALLITESNPSLLRNFAERAYAIERGEVTEVAGGLAASSLEAAGLH